jgi:hypothetical protein
MLAVLGLEYKEDCAGVMSVLAILDERPECPWILVSHGGLGTRAPDSRGNCIVKMHGLLTLPTPPPNHSTTGENLKSSAGKNTEKKATLIFSVQTNPC